MKSTEEREEKERERKRREEKGREGKRREEGREREEKRREKREREEKRREKRSEERRERKPTVVRHRQGVSKRRKKTKGNKFDALLAHLHARKTSVLTRETSHCCQMVPPPIV